MSVIKINAITVADGGVAELESRFAARAGEVDHMPRLRDRHRGRPLAAPTNPPAA
ncbi:MAG: hypothetical protein HYX32_07680 [Actinobacteria bacterium]|nr:hypothetical protein [Actinomycetota bacterium]